MQRVPHPRVHAFLSKRWTCMSQSWYCLCRAGYGLIQQHAADIYTQSTVALFLSNLLQSGRWIVTTTFSWTGSPCRLSSFPRATQVLLAPCFYISRSHYACAWTHTICNIFFLAVLLAGAGG